MVIYGTALLALCHLAGLFFGDLLGSAIGVKANVGGVGIAMLLLISSRLWLHRRGLLPKETEAGVGFWGAMYIPVVVAMAAQQNVVTALRGGPVALLAAVGAVLVCACCIAAINRLGQHEPLPAATQDQIA
nr:malonate transporter subunit MadL [uncultured Pseudogulbenkiania sp.]